MAAVFPANQVIVVGGGLAGMSAANTVVENGGRTLLLDKSSFCGGNSTKATSGINGAGTKTQKSKSIPDNADAWACRNKRVFDSGEGIRYIHLYTRHELIEQFFVDFGECEHTLLTKHQPQHRPRQCWSQRSSANLIACSFLSSTKDSSKPKP